MIKMIKKRNLGAHFAITMSIVLLATILLMTTYNMYLTKRLTELNNSEKQSYNKTISNLVVEAVKNDISRKNFDYTQRTTKNLVLNNLTSYVSIIDKNTGKVVWSTIPHLKGEKKTITEMNQLFIKNSYYSIAGYKFYTITDNVRNYQVVTAFTSENLVTVYIKSMLESNKALTLFFIFLGLVSAFLMAKSVTTPLKNLAIASKAISEGNLKYKIKETEFTEINILVKAFNDMAEKLDQSYSFLEQKVKDRTEELEKANKDLKETQAMMVHSEKMKSLGELVAGITHEINNPVNFIYGNLSHLNNYSKELVEIIEKFNEVKHKLPPEDIENLNTIMENVEYNFIKDDLPDLLRSCKDGAERTKNIIFDLKSFSRLDSMTVNEVDVHKEIELTLNILHNKYKNKITVHKEYGNIPIIESYGGQLNQVFMNILDNASYAIESKGDVYIRTKMEDKDTVLIEVEDTGRGIDQTNLSKVFEPFFTTKPVGEGSGLGMAISYKVIKNHNGDIKIFSQPDQGTKVVIKLPVRGLMSA